MKTEKKSLAEKLKAKEILAQQFVKELKTKEKAMPETEKKEDIIGLTDPDNEKKDFKNILGCGG